MSEDVRLGRYVQPKPVSSMEWGTAVVCWPEDLWGGHAVCPDTQACKTTSHFSDTISCVLSLAEEEAGRSFAELMRTSVLLESLHLQKVWHVQVKVLFKTVLLCMNFYEGHNVFSFLVYLPICMFTHISLLFTFIIDTFHWVLTPPSNTNGIGLKSFDLSLFLF